MAAAGPTHEIPFGGNAYITHRRNEDSPEVINDAGLANWMDSETICSLMFHLHHGDRGHGQEQGPGTVTFDFGLRLYVAQEGRSVIRVALQDQEYYAEISGGQPHVVSIGQLQVQLHGETEASAHKCQHHVQIDLQGIENTCGFFADVSHGIVSNLRYNGSPNPCLRLSYVDSEFSFHFGRRGPSVHLNYEVPSSGSGSDKIEYFYNEVMVPPGQNMLGSYFCAIAFNGGYFGIQVNSPTERRVLFSIWSAFETDCPDSIPAGYRVQLLRKGDGVHAQAFGCEGSGQQSFLRYNWQAGNKYKFLVRATPAPNGENNTTFTAWFWSGQWQLIASFRKPHARTHLDGLYSFAENFQPDMGHITRKVYFGNQWARTTHGRWLPVNRARFTGDDTSKQCRKDYAGGTEGGMFYLEHCGFLCHRVDTNQAFCCGEINHVMPDVSVETLP